MGHLQRWKWALRRKGKEMYYKGKGAFVTIPRAVIRGEKGHKCEGEKGIYYKAKGAHVKVKCAFIGREKKHY